MPLYYKRPADSSIYQVTYYSSIGDLNHTDVLVGARLSVINSSGNLRYIGLTTNLSSSLVSYIRLRRSSQTVGVLEYSKSGSITFSRSVAGDTSIQQIPSNAISITYSGSARGGGCSSGTRGAGGGGAATVKYSTSNPTYLGGAGGGGGSGGGAATNASNTSVSFSEALQAGASYKLTIGGGGAGGGSVSIIGGNPDTDSGANPSATGQNGTNGLTSNAGSDSTFQRTSGGGAILQTFSGRASLTYSAGGSGRSAYQARSGDGGSGTGTAGSLGSSNTVYISDPSTNNGSTGQQAGGSGGETNNDGGTGGSEWGAPDTPSFPTGWNTQGNPTSSTNYSGTVGNAGAGSIVISYVLEGD